MNGANVEPSEQIKCDIRFPLADTEREMSRSDKRGGREKRSGFDIANCGNSPLTGAGIEHQLSCNIIIGYV